MIVTFFMKLAKFSLFIALIGGAGYFIFPKKKEKFLVVVIGWVFAMILCVFCAAALQMRI
ncbi:MAG: hypothetical protein MR520_00240 [Mollicutes bacterium]|nr:hypothetical protein [Mollicutes bacterium]